MYIFLSDENIISYFDADITAGSQENLFLILFLIWLQIDFHDTGRGPRVPSMTDHFGFTMASLNESGSVFANPCKGEKNLSTLMYRPFCTWANNSEVRRFSLYILVSLRGDIWTYCCQLQLTYEAFFFFYKH